MSSTTNPASTPNLTSILRAIFTALCNHLLAVVHSWHDLYHTVKHTYRSTAHDPDTQAYELLSRHGVSHAYLKVCVAGTVKPGGPAPGEDGKAGRGGGINPFHAFPSVENCFVVPWGLVFLYLLLVGVLLPIAWRLLKIFLKLAIQDLWRVSRWVLRLVWRLARMSEGGSGSIESHDGGGGGDGDGGHGGAGGGSRGGNAGDEDSGPHDSGKEKPEPNAKGRGKESREANGKVEDLTPKGAASEPTPISKRTRRRA